jgi:Sigma-70 region 2
MMPVAMTHDGSLERNSLGGLYFRHAPECIRLAFLLTGDRAVAEDLVQGAFAPLVGRLRHLRDPGAFSTYLREREEGRRCLGLGLCHAGLVLPRQGGSGSHDLRLLPDC